MNYHHDEQITTKRRLEPLP